MITIQSGKLIIPENERFVGFAGDNASMTRQFLLQDRADENCFYTLCLRFDDDTAGSAPLDAAIEGGDTLLTWQIRRDDIRRTGIVMAQVKIADSEGNITHTSRDYFLVGSSAESDDSGADIELITRSALTEALQSLSSTAPYVGEDGYWYVFSYERRDYQKTGYHISGRYVDMYVDGNSANPVSNRAIKDYVDDVAFDLTTAKNAAVLECKTYADASAQNAAANKVDNTLQIAGIPLTDDITAKELTDHIYRRIFKTLVDPAHTFGYEGQYGLDTEDHPIVCLLGYDWIRLATEDELDTRLSTVYTKEEIDAKLGDIESLLAAV